MFFTLLYHSLGFRAHREEVKNIIEVDNNIEEASNKLSAIITEHDSYKETFSDDSTINLDNLSLHHAKDHLDAFQETATIEQKEAATKALDE